MAGNTYLLTGTAGCIGAWALKHLLERGDRVIATDVTEDRARPRLVASDELLDQAVWQTLDVTDTSAVRRAVGDHGVTRIIHLAGLQIPFCRANPPLGAAVNVEGTVNIFEAARHEGVTGLSYASSIAALGPASAYDTWPLPDDCATLPTTLYGVYKVANEETARIYAQDWGLGSIGLRPYTVYGIGRDQGMTADPSKAILAAVLGRPYHIRFSGPMAFQHASDAARIFIACADAQATEARVCNLRNDVATVDAFVSAIQGHVPEAQITTEAGTTLPFPSDLDDSGLRQLIGTVPHTPLADAIGQDLVMYREAVDKGIIDLTQLDR